MASCTFKHKPWSILLGINQLIRQYFRKETSLEDIVHDQIKVVQNKLRHRAQKALGLKTPFEVFFDKIDFFTIELIYKVKQYELLRLSYELVKKVIIKYHTQIIDKRMA